MSLSEMLFIGLLGLAIFGPRKLATLGQQAGQTLARLKKISNEFKSQLDAETSATASYRPMERRQARPEATSNVGHWLGLPFGVDGLVEIDPEHAGQQCDRGRERQEQHDGPDRIFRDPPASHRPQQCRKERDDHDSQTVTDIHRAQEVARFAVKFEIADGAALVHHGKSPEDGITENVSRAAPGTALAKNIARR